MARYNFNLQRKELIDKMRSPLIYEYNMAENLALLSNDVSVIRRFYQVEIQKYFQDTWLTQEASNKFLAQYIEGQAFAYFGLIPMIVQGKVNLLTSNGFECKSDNAEVDTLLNEIKDDCELQKKFADGVYYESGLGDFAYRVSYHKEVSDRPIIDIIEPQFLEIEYRNGIPQKFIIKEVSNDDPSYELREIHYKNDRGFACIKYRFWKDNHYIADNDEAGIKEAKTHFDVLPNLEPIELPLKDFLVIFKKNTNRNLLYRGERGVPDIQGLASIEDALTETTSDLIDAIRKGGIKTYISDELIPQDENGNDLKLNHFNKTIITTKGSSNPADNGLLYQVVQGQINWEAYTRTIQNLMSIAINKAGMSPTTIGITGLESINSSQESQDAREKPSLRLRELCLNEWQKTLKDLLNRYLQMVDITMGRDPKDYSNLINISFNEYISPNAESITDVLTRQVAAGIKSRQSAIKELNDGWSNEQVDSEFMKIIDENTPVEGTLGEVIENENVSQETMGV